MSSHQEQVAKKPKIVHPEENEPNIKEILQKELKAGIPLDPLPSLQPIDNSVPHAPKRALFPSSNKDFKLAIQNALRYFPVHLHSMLAEEFAEELKKYGHIYMYRFRPTNYKMKAYPIEYYPAKTKQAASIMLMIQNNLDPSVAQYPHELITYGGNGSVLSNWAQYHLVMQYLSQMDEDQTLVLYSGHPLGLFPSSREAPRLVISNGMVVPNYSSREDYERMYGLGVSMYGQMTAGSYCYIGPQGIVHGTTITILNAGRKYLQANDLAGKVFVSSGLGGMSGAQPKAGFICGAISVVAEINGKKEDGWMDGWMDGWIYILSSILGELLETDSKRYYENQTFYLICIGLLD